MVELVVDNEGCCTRQSFPIDRIAGGRGFFDSNPVLDPVGLDEAHSMKSTVDVLDVGISRNFAAVFPRRAETTTYFSSKRTQY